MLNELGFIWPPRLAACWKAEGWGGEGWVKGVAGNLTRDKDIG